MSSLIVYALVPKGTKDAELGIADFMRAYSSELKVPSHQKVCRCVAYKAEAEAKRLPKDSFPRLEAGLLKFTREEFENRELVDAEVKRFFGLGSPDANCKECDGSGVLYTMESPEPKWSGWAVGEGPADRILKESLTVETADPNVVAVRNIDLDKLPLPEHLIAPDGHCFSERRFLNEQRCCVIDTKWGDTVKSVLEKYRDHMLVAVDAIG